MKPKRIVLKFGTGVLTRQNGCQLDPSQFSEIARQVAALRQAGHACIIVSSAAIAAGVDALGLPARPDDLPGKQACAAAGQPRLMRLYERVFARHGLLPAQLLLTHDDIDSTIRRRNALATLERLLSIPRVVPIINENDSVAVEELRVGDNDRLGAETAILLQADLFIVLTSTDGILGNGRRIPIVRDFEELAGHITDERGKYSVGGMRTKVEAVRMAVEAGVPSVIVDGRRSGTILLAAAGRSVGTRFPVSPKPKKKKRSSAKC